MTFRIIGNSYKNDKITYEDTINKDESTMLARQIRDAVEKDPLSKAYTKPFLENILDNEINRSIRYKLELSLIMVEITNVENSEERKNSVMLLSQIVNKKIRTSDYFGAQSNNRYLIILTNTSLSGAVILAERIEKKLIKKSGNSSVFLFGVTALSEIDTKEMLLEKLEDATQKAMQDKTKKIEIEV